MTYKLGKPPVIETWIQATMEAAPDSQWDWEVAHTMLKEYRDEYPIVEHLTSYTSKVTGINEDQLPTGFEVRGEIEYMRARTENRSKIVQLGQNDLKVAFGLEDDGAHLGFEKLLGSFSDALERYREHIPTVGVSLVELHYADLVVIPDMYSEEVNLQDLFVGSPDLPEEPFGAAARAAWSISLSCPSSEDMAQVSVQMQPPDGQDGRFRIDWHCWCGDLASDGPDVIAQRLENAHNYLSSCFQAIFQPRVWNLFEPKCEKEK